MKVTIIDYGLSNLLSVQHAFAHFGAETLVTDKAADILAAEALVLPGVGAFQDGMNGLEKLGLVEPIRQKAAAGTLLLGICLGMQMLFDKSLENGEFDCLGVFRGKVVPFEISLRVPHIGWNSIEKKDIPLFAGLKEREYVYFVHSYYASEVPAEDVITQTEYEIPFVSGVGRYNVFGLQFHPEKSGNTGLKILENFGGLR